MPSSTALSTFQTANTTAVDVVTGLLTTGNVIVLLLVCGGIALLVRWIKHGTHKATRF